MAYDANKREYERQLRKWVEDALGAGAGDQLVREHQQPDAVKDSPIAKSEPARFYTVLRKCYNCTSASKSAHAYGMTAPRLVVCAVCGVESAKKVAQ